MNSNQLLYRTRSTTDNVNMVFDFVGENWRKWFKMMLYFLLPFSVLLGSTMAMIYNDAESSTSAMTYALTAIVFVAGCAVVTTLEILLVKWHKEHGGTLDGCEVGIMLRIMPRPLLRCSGVVALGTPLLLLALASVVLLPIVGFVALFAVLPIFLVCPIMLLEPKQAFSNLISRAFSLGFKKWGALILIAIIMEFVAILINNASGFPLTLLTVLDETLELSKPDAVFWSFVIDLVRYLMCVAQSFSFFTGIGLFVMAMTYHYGSVATQVEDIGLESDIDNFAQL